MHLYSSPLPGRGQQGCLRLGTLCLEVETGHNRSYSPLFAGEEVRQRYPARTARFPQIQSLHRSHRCKSSMDFLPPAKTEAIRSSGERVSRPLLITAGIREPCADVNAFHLFSSFAVNLTVKPPYQNRICLPHIAGKRKRAAPKRCCPLVSLHKYKIENAAPIFLPCPKTTILRAAFPRR